MTVIYKYKVDIVGETQIESYKDFTPRHFGIQKGVTYLWAEVDVNSGKATQVFRTFFTGEDIINNMGFKFNYIGSAISEDGAYVGHLYQKVGMLG